MNNQKPTITPKSLARLIQDSPTGIVKRQHLHSRWQKVNHAIREAKKRRLIGVFENYIYDPKRLDKDGAVQTIQQNGHSGLPDFGAMVREALESADVPALFEQELETRIGDYFSMSLLSERDLEDTGINLLELKLFQPYTDWYYLISMDYETVYDYALTEAENRHEQDWQRILDWAGDELRVDAAEGDSTRMKALARLYTRAQLGYVVDLPERVLRLAQTKGYLKRITCPDGARRMRARDVHRLRDDRELRQSLEDALELNIWQLRNLTDLKISYLRTLLHNEGVKPSSRSKNNDSYGSIWYRWGDLRQVLWPDNDHPSMSDLEIIEETGGAGRQAWWSDRIINIHHEIEEKKRQQRETKDRRRRERREKRDVLRAQMIDNFPNWLRDDEIEQVAYIHVGPTNSGKTHDALLELAQAGSGWYLAPLRLLAREMFERLNRMGVYCNLVTGEERIMVPGAQVTAATVEMFNPDRSGNCVIIDEAHMIADDQRGWAWTQALVNARAPQLRIITAPYGQQLLSRVFDAMGTETQVLYHNRMVALDVAPKPWSLDELPARTILIAFTRRDVLQLKHYLQQRGRSVSVVYGALPPEVRLKQAQRFEDGKTEICVATDAVGMGLNLPADNVVFSTMKKFDGYQLRYITASELQQIAGRAGRYGLSDKGWVGGIDKEILDRVRRLMAKDIPDLDVARIAPRTDEIELLEGDLAQRLMTWQELKAIPDALRTILTSTQMEDRIELAQFLSYADLMKLGVERALLLVSAPVRRESQEYWVECATAILRGESLPLPPPPPLTINEGKSLKMAEAVIACIDVYLWLGYREPFQHSVENPEPIIELREELTREIDVALMRRFDPNAYIRPSRGLMWEEEDF